MSRLEYLIKHLRPTQIFSYLLFFLSACILLVSFLLTMNVDVLKDWKLVVPTSQIHAGDTVTIISEYTKLRDVKGTASRYVECKNNKGVYVRYPLNEAVADRASGTGGTGIVVKIPPFAIPDLPTTCKFTIAIEYEVYPWRTVNEVNSSNEFKLLPATRNPNEVTLFYEPSTKPKSPAQVRATAQGLGFGVVLFSSSQHTLPATVVQSVN